MARTTHHVDAPVEQVFTVLADPWTYPSWLVGCKQIRGVDGTWPAVGSCFHHRVGVGPFTLPDSTKVVEVEPPTRLVLEVRARPLGRGMSAFTLRPVRGGTEVTVVEEPIWTVLEVVTRPLLELNIHLRNVVSLRRLADRAERLSSPAAE